MYFDYISEDLNQPVVNYSKGGMCNEYIFHQFMKYYHKINPGDIVIFGWSNISRYLMPHPTENRWITNIFQTNSFSSELTDGDIVAMRAHPLFVKKQMDVIRFIDTLLPNNKTIHWTWFVKNLKDILSITEETNGEVTDFHYGEYGHKELYERMNNELKITNRVKLNLWYYDAKLI